MTAEEFIERKLQQRLHQGTYRQLRPESNLIDFCSNDYLGFAQSKALADLINQELQQLGTVKTGSTGSRLLNGNTCYTEELENSIAQYHEAEAGLLFNSGYDANIGLLSCLPQRHDTVIHDELAHASIIDGVRLSQAKRYSFKHNDTESLEQKLRNATGLPYIVVESVYSMDGDLAPLPEIARLAKQYKAALIVDEAHALGVFGKGLVNQLQPQNDVFARIITFGKALGCHGAIVIGSGKLRAYLINFARSFIYTTAAPMHQLASIKMGYQLLQESPQLVNNIHSHIKLFRDYMTDAKQLSASNSAIQTFIIGGNEKTKWTATFLQKQGLDVRPILSPTVPSGTERLRICLHTFNTAEQIQQLSYHLKTLKA